MADSTFLSQWKNTWRDYQTDGQPLSGDNNPDKAEIRAVGSTMDALFAAAVSGDRPLVSFTPAGSSGSTGYPTTGGSGPGGAIREGDQFIADSAGFIRDQAIEGGDLVIAKVDTPGQTADNWSYINRGFGFTPASQADLEAVEDQLPHMLRQADTKEAGLGVVAVGEKFCVPTDEKLSVYEKANSRNLYNTANRREGYYVSSGSGRIFSADGFAATGFIPVTPGLQYTISADAPRAAQVGWYGSQDDDDVVDFYTASNTNAVVTLTAPAGAAYMVATVKTTSVDEPSEIMISQSAAALPFEPYGTAVAILVGEYAPFAPVDGVTEFVVSPNMYNPENKRIGKYVSSVSGNIVSGAGWDCSEFMPVTAGLDYTISSNTPRQAEIGFFSSATDTGASTGVFSGVANTLNTVTAPAGSNYMVITVNSTITPEPTQIMVNEGDSALPYEPYDVGKWMIKPEAVPGYEPPESVTLSKLVLNLGGNESIIDSRRSGRRIRNTFIVGAPIQLLSHPTRLNFRKTYLDAVLVRDSSDDIAPDVAMGVNIGGNHGYMLGVCTTAGHGKTTDDEGSVWATGGNQYVLVKVVDTSVLLLARRLTNDTPVTGTYTHVSGATNTGSITVSAVTANQWYPCDQDYTVTMLIDGDVVSLTDGEYTYSDNVQFVETCNIMTRQSIIDWWIANGGASGGIQPVGTTAYSLTTTTHFDRDGQMTVHWDWVILSAMNTTYFRGAQVYMAGSPDEIYIPGCIPMSYNSTTIDLSRKIEADFTVTSGERLYLTTDDCQLEGECGHRIMSLWDNYVYSVGIVPVADASYDVRRDRVDNNVLDIATNGKQYFRVLDQGVQTLNVGDHFSAVIFRHIMPTSPERTSFNVVRMPSGDTWIYADWHDKSGLDRLPMPSDLTGCDFEVMDSRNASVQTSLLAGSLPVLVSCVSDYGYIVLKASA